VKSRKKETLEKSKGERGTGKVDATGLGFRKMEHAEGKDQTNKRGRMALRRGNWGKDSLLNKWIGGEGARNSDQE